MCGPAAPKLLLLRGLGLLCAVLLQGARSFETPSYFEVTVPMKLETKVEGGAGYTVTVGGVTYSLRLLQNRGLLSPGLALYTHTNAGYQVIAREAFRRDCYYQGVVEGIPRSIVALSLCAGLRGFLQTETVTYAIEPAEFSSNFQHLIYKVEDVDNDPKSCYTTQPIRTYQEKYHYTLHHTKRPNKASQAYFVELHVIIDYDLYLQYSENSTALIETVFQLVNMADAMFAPLNVHLVLLGLEIWKMQSLIPSPVDIQTFLQNLASWKEENTIPDLKVDMTVLLRNTDIKSVVGATYAEGICWGQNAVMFAAFTTLPRRGLPAIATTVAHELGHTLGMLHDSDYFTQCHCSLGSCIMFLGKVTTTSFSDCSIKYFEHFISNGSGFCLQNVSFAESFVVVPYCGNKAVEGEEKCDCGSARECTSDQCCDATCQLKGDAQCGSGECCDTCKFVKKGTPCRIPVSECDLAEYCNGTSAMCPADVYYQNGSPCNHNKSYCVNSKCYDYIRHCKQLFGTDATVAPTECFAAVNINGDRFGNCGFEGAEPKKCELKDVMCGRVQCMNVDNIRIYNSHSATLQTPVEDNSCWGVDYHYSYGTNDFGVVEDGAKCGIGMVCVNRTCVDISILDYDCNIQEKCSGNGVCNNNKNCHCNKDWAPPECKFKGNGGSIDSGPLVKGSFLSYVSPTADEFKFLDLGSGCGLTMTTHIALLCSIYIPNFLIVRILV